MNREDTTFDVDLYSDFLSGENDESNAENEKDRAFNELQEKYEEALKSRDELRAKNEELVKKNETLVMNLTKLFKTARKEIYVKNKELKKMRERLDNIIFRRASKQDMYLNSPSNRQNHNIVTSSSSPPEQQLINDEGKTNFNHIDKNNNSFNTISSSKPNEPINGDSKHLLKYYPQTNHKKTVKKPKISKISKSDDKTGKFKMADDKETNLKRKISDKITSSKTKKPRIEIEDIRRDDRSSKIQSRKSGENKDVEDGEILSDSEIKSNKDRRRNDSERRRPSVIKSNNCKNEYLKQLEVNRMKMQVRREKILLVKAKEDRRHCNFNSESQRRICR